jgi:hypothetical protein
MNDSPRALLVPVSALWDFCTATLLSGKAWLVIIDGMDRNKGFFAISFFCWLRSCHLPDAALQCQHIIFSPLIVNFIQFLLPNSYSSVFGWDQPLFCFYISKTKEHL